MSEENSYDCGMMAAARPEIAFRFFRKDSFGVCFFMDVDLMESQTVVTNGSTPRFKKKLKVP